MWLCFLLLLFTEDDQLTQAEVGQNTGCTIDFPHSSPGRLTLFTAVKCSTSGVSFKYYRYGATEHFLLKNKENVRAAVL